ncbi:hypothetical protein [Bradyrhizobium sp.]|uniref:hypothetical protein n=1 Tax=Bradyrhizobium sp. TaxID=376 RepID=UPI002DF98FF9|nr:hypothetical protein [Bradyrhizobium sp.]
MSFSMPSYFLGVGTVVGALALGFGGGIVLTKTAIKDSSGPSRMERAARSEPANAAPQVTEAKAVPVPRADQAGVAPPIAEPVRQIESHPVQAAVEPRPAAEPKPVVEARPEPARIAEPVRQIDISKAAEQPIQQADAPKQMQADAPKQIEPPARQAEARQVEQKESEQRNAEREQRRAEQRRIEREKRNAERERKARSVIIVRRQRPVEEPDQFARSELAFEREEPRPNLFEGLFGRPAGESRD